MQPGSSRGFTLIKRVQMESNKTKVYLQTLHASPLFLAKPFISSDLPETSLLSQSI